LVCPRVVDLTSVVIPPSYPSAIIVSPAGRKRKVSDAVISIVKKLTYDNNVAGNSLSSREILKIIEIERHKELTPGDNRDALKPISKSLGLQILKQIAPIYIRNPDNQNTRRLAAKSDMYNQVSLAAVATAIFGSITEGVPSPYIPENVHCMDAMTVVMFDVPKEGVRVDGTAVTELKRKSRSISTTKNQPQRRVVKCYFDTTAAGYLNAVIISITDRKFKERRKWFQVDSGSDQYVLWILCISKETKESENEKNKENIPNSNNNNSNNSKRNNANNNRNNKKKNNRNDNRHNNNNSNNNNRSATSNQSSR
jgi:hypothetical protein